MADQATLGEVSVEIGGNLDKLQKALADGKAATSRFDQSVEKAAGNSVKKLESAATGAAAAVRKTAAATKEASASLQQNTKVTNDNAAAQARSAAATKASGQAYQLTAGQIRAATEQTKALNAAQMRIVASYNPIRKAQASFMRDFADINLLQREGRISGEQHTVYMTKALYSYRQSASAVDDLGQSYGGAMGSARAFIGLVGITGAIQIANFAIKTLGAVGALGDLSEQIGVSTRDIQALQMGAKQYGITNDELAVSLGRFNKSIGEAASGSKQDIRLLTALGISLKDIKSGAASAGTELPKVAEFLRRIESPAQRAAVLVKLFGEEAGPKMGLLLKDGAAGIDNLRDAAERLGVVLSEKQIADADKTADKLEDIKTVLSANISGVVSDNAGAILELANAFAELAGWAIKAVGALIAFSKTPVGGTLVSAGSMAVNPLGAITGTVANVYNRATGQTPKGGSSVRVPLGPAAPKPLSAPEQALLDKAMTRGGGGSGGGSDGAAEARRRLRDEKAYNDKISRLEQQQLAAKQQLTTDIIAQSQLERESLETERKAAINEIEIEQQGGQITAARADRLRAETEALFYQKADLINHRENEQLASNELDLRQAVYDDQVAIMEAVADMARTSAERRTVERRILELEYQREKAELQRLADDKYATPGERAVATQRLGTIDQRYGGRREAMRQSTRDDLLRNDASLGGSGEFAQAAALEEVKREQEERLALIQEAQEEEIISAQDAAARRVEIERDANQQIIDIEAARQSVTLMAAQSTAESLMQIAGTLAGEQSAAYRAMFAISKAFAIADSIIKIQAALANALSLPFPANIPAFATVAALGAGIISNIAQVSAGFEKGGFTGSGGDSDVAGLVHRNEFVFDAPTTARNRGLFEMIHAGRDPGNAYAASPGTNARSSAGGVNVQINNLAPGIEFEVARGLTIDDVVITARRVVREDAPGIIATDIGRSNSRTSKALQRHVDAGRRRT